ncbi:PAS domain S-box protein [Paenibacillus sp. MMS20-IR301]|uniref:SpoIIE family protein phosphatase n=1 Tax=Paenibacillus sp. MMS20-IR301 TaxID=2895946 RepID=UPI0028F076ED|nr:PAS domain S-box protein [Paenibacillus sp. MMS20-IR301]WNS44608.1 PAS domain S-box protein [Paenibacillus sp. MMS20-IR301]
MATDKNCKNQHRSPTEEQCMDHYGCIYENNHLITLLVDPQNGGIVDANRVACDFYGYRLREFRKLRISDLTADREQGVQQFVEKALPTDEAQKNRVFTDRHVLASGQAIDVEVHTGMMTMLGRNCVYTVIHDISERVRSEKRLRESEERYRDLVELCPEAILVYSGGTILFANRQAERMFGNKKNELVGKGLEDFFNEVYFQSAEHNKLQTTGLLKERFRIEQRLIRIQDNRVFDLEISGVPVIYEEEKALQLVLRDITDSKREIERAVRLQEHRHAVSFPLEGKAVLEKLYIPARTLSGDFFIFHKINEEQVIGIIGDVTGKGITAALNISALRVLFMDSLMNTQDPLQMLKDLNNKALQHLGEDYFAACCFRLDFTAGVLKAAGAGINEFLFVPGGSSSERITVKGTPLGMFADSEFEETSIPFASGDRFCFYSDGMELRFDSEELAAERGYLLERLAGAALQDDCTWFSLNIK